MKPLSIVKQLCNLPSRIGESEADCRQLITDALMQAAIPFELQEFNSKRPNFIDYSLKVDGVRIDCLPTGLMSGEITNNYNLISSLTSSQSFIDTPNINFNPKSDAICQCNFYFAPSLAISRRDVPKVMNAKEIHGNVIVEPIKYRTANILVGNRINPKTIVFAHYDAYFAGATDNASGVAVALSLIQQEPILLKDTLVVFAGNEELSYDYPIYWGRCFREFARQNRRILESTERIIVIDSVGDGEPVLETDPKLLSLAFPIGDEPDILMKSCILTGDFDSLMTVYHSASDVVSRLSPAYLDSALILLRELLKTQKSRAR